MNPLKLAVIGGGPSAFYVASRLLKLLPEAQNLRVHLFDRLWAPHGLVRYGVAPDHPEVKNCTHKFDQTAEDARFRFFGNVDVGDSANMIPHALQVPLTSIYKNYTQVLFATGCPLPNLHSALPPSEHCVPALSLVHWYTQHPNTPPPPPLDKIRHVSLIGNGNVALDVARMLLTNVDVLAKYDVPQSVLELLSRSTVEHVSIIARRGPLEAAFTMKELRELINLPDAAMLPIDPALLAPALPGGELTRQQTRVLDLLKKGSKNTPGTTRKTWSLEFFRAPVGLVPPAPGAPSAQLSLAHTALDPATHTALPTGKVSTIGTDLVVPSLGFHGEPTAPFYDPSVGHTRAAGTGRVKVGHNEYMVARVGEHVLWGHGEPLRGAYASGWAATGAKGVLAATMMDAYTVADSIVFDWTWGVSSAKAMQRAAAAGEEVLPLAVDPVLDEPPEEVRKGLDEGRVTQYADWKRIDAEEVRRGAARGKERERMGWEEARAFIARTA